MCLTIITWMSWISNTQINLRRFSKSLKTITWVWFTSSRRACWPTRLCAKARWTYVFSKRKSTMTRTPQRLSWMPRSTLSCSSLWLSKSGRLPFFLGNRKPKQANVAKNLQTTPTWASFWRNCALKSCLSIRKTLVRARWSQSQPWHCSTRSKYESSGTSETWHVSEGVTKTRSRKSRPSKPYVTKPSYTNAMEWLKLKILKKQKDCLKTRKPSCVPNLVRMCSVAVGPTSSAWRWRKWSTRNA